MGQPDLLAIAHRAGNSLPALRGATALGADVIEADVHHYRGRLEVRHQKTLGPVPVLWDKWQLVPGWAPRLLLHELIQAAEGGALFMLDLKGHSPQPGRDVAALLHEHAHGRPVIVCSRSWPALEPFWALPWARVVLSARTPAELDRLRPRIRADPAPYAVSIHRSLVSAALVSELRDRVEVFMSWPVNDESALREVVAAGVNGIISDSPRLLRVVLERP